jgi:glucose/mannose transport system substrate-binding protein
VPMAPTATTAPVAAKSHVEVFSWWVGPGEADGLVAMVKICEYKYPNITFANAAEASDTGTNAKMNALMAATLLAALPTALVYGFLGRYFLRGLIAGALKG